jgi:hypothetical protein
VEGLIPLFEEGKQLKDEPKKWRREDLCLVDWPNLPTGPGYTSSQREEDEEPRAKRPREVAEMNLKSTVRTMAVFRHHNAFS